MSNSQSHEMMSFDLEIVNIVDIVIVFWRQHDLAWSPQLVSKWSSWSTNNMIRVWMYHDHGYHALTIIS